MADARVVDDFVGDGDLPAEIILFENQHAIAGASEIQAGGESRRPPPMTTTSYRSLRLIWVMIWNSLHMHMPLPAGSREAVG